MLGHFFVIRRISPLFPPRLLLRLLIVGPLRIPLLLLKTLRFLMNYLAQNAPSFHSLYTVIRLSAGIYEFFLAEEVVWVCVNIS